MVLKASGLLFRILLVDNVSSVKLYVAVVVPVTAKAELACLHIKRKVTNFKDSAFADGATYMFVKWITGELHLAPEIQMAFQGIVEHSSISNVKP